MGVLEIVATFQKGGQKLGLLPQARPHPRFHSKTTVGYHFTTDKWTDSLSESTNAVIAG